MRTNRDISIALASLVADCMVYEGYVDKEAGTLIFDALSEGLIAGEIPSSTLLDIESFMELRRDEMGSEFIDGLLNESNNT